MTKNKDLYDIRGADHQIVNGNLVLFYSSLIKSPPSGMECTLPLSPVEPDEREIDLRFAGGGMEWSNTLDVAYAVGPGDGLCLAPLHQNISADYRTGYIFRLLRHGDGTNEAIFYRNDTGWTNLLKNDWLPFNPITTLRRIVVRHRQNGEHLITCAFDTGSVFEKTFAYDDDLYPPNNIQRGLQLIATGYGPVRTATPIQIRTDTWIVQDRSTNLKPRVIESRKPGAPPDNADALDLLGQTRAADGNYSDAFKYLTRGLNIRRQLYGEDHPKVADSLDHLAKIYVRKDLAKVEQLYKQSLQIREKKLGPLHPDVASSLNGLAEFYYAQGNNAEAERMYGRLLDIQEKVLGPEHREVAEILTKLAGIYDGQKQYDKEEPVLNRAVTIKEKDSGADPLKIAQDLQALAIVYQKLGQLSKIEPPLARALEIKEKYLEPDNPELAKTISNLAVIYQNQGKYADAEKLYKRALAIEEKARGAEHPLVGGNLYNLGVLYMTQGRFAESESMLRRALDISEKALGPNDPNVAVVLEKLSRLYNKMGRALEAAYYDQRAKTIRGVK